MVSESAPLTVISQDRLSVLAETVRQCAKLPGEMAEVGTYKGGSARVIAAACPGKYLHLFDTFGTGIPEDDQHGEHKAGDFGDVSFEQVKRYLDGFNVVFHPGLFPKTAEPVRERRFCFVHLDGDTYQTTKAGLEFFWPRMVEGGAIVLDDWDWERCPGVRKAVEEVLPGVKVEQTAFAQARVTKPKCLPKREGCGCSNRERVRLALS